jgi:sulfotransferase
MPAKPQSAKPPEKLHFISGLPRSGSTLLSAILRQNPRFHAGMTSPVGDMVSVLVAEMSGKNDFSVAISDQQRQAVLRGVFQNFYGGLLGTDVVFDTGRMWCSKLPLLATLFPNSRVIACVRELPWVLDSVERLVRKQPLTVNKIFHFNPNGTVYSRAESLIDVNGMVGFSFQATKDAWYGQYASGRMLLLTYESLTRDPKAAMQAVYKFIDEPWGEIEGVGAQTRNGAAARPVQALRQRFVLAGSREQHPQGAGGVGGLIPGLPGEKPDVIVTLRWASLRSAPTYASRNDRHKEIAASRSTTAAPSNAAANPCGRCATALTTKGPTIWPIANAAVITAMNDVASAPAARRASRNPSIVTTM